MGRAISVVCVGLLASVLLAGCATSAAVDKVTERLNVLEGKVAADLKASAASSEKTEKSVLAADERLKVVEKTVADKTSALEAGLGNMQRSLKTTADEMVELQKEMAAFSKTIDENLAKMNERAAKTEKDAETAAKQLPVVRAEIAKFKLQFTQMDASVKDAQAMILKNLEGTRQIYIEQYKALGEMLKQLKKAEKPVPPATSE